MSILKKRYSFVIFDWDGTLMDSTGRIVSSMQTTAKIAGLPIPGVESVKSIIGLSMDAVMDTMFPSANESQRKELFEIYRHQYVEGDDTPSPLFEGTLPLLNWLKQKDISVAVATGKARHGLTRVLNEVDLNHFFDHTICADEAESKPHPEMVHRLIEQAGKTKQETLVIGDSVHDLKMANNAKVDAVAVTSGANQSEQLSEHKPVSILPRVCELRQWLES